MSWEIDSVDKIKCPCGKGEIIRENRSDDWNRADEMVFLQCKDCSEKYHIESKVGGYGIDTFCLYYLINNGETIQNVYGNSSSFEEYLACNYDLVQLKEAVETLNMEKYASRIKGNVANEIIASHRKRFKTVKLIEVIPRVEQSVLNYNNYEWNKTKCEMEQKKRDAVKRIPIIFN